MGRRAKVAERADRARRTLTLAIRLCVVALVPGLPFWVRGKRALGLVVLGAWAITLTCFLVTGQVEEHLAIRVWLPMFGGIQFEPVYLWYGLAAGVHIASVAEQFRPLLQAHIRHRDLRSRFLLTLGATLVLGWLLYFGLYAPLLV